MAESTARRKAIKLKTPVTRDSFYTWTLNHQAFCCQEPAWRQFCPGMEGITTWLPKNEDDTRGVKVYRKNVNGQEVTDANGQRIVDRDGTNSTRLALESFLVCLGTYCPDHFMHSVVQESTSYNWVMDKIKTNLQTGNKRTGIPRRSRYQDRLHRGGPDPCPRTASSQRVLL